MICSIITIYCDVITAYYMFQELGGNGGEINLTTLGSFLSLRELMLI